MRSPSFKSALRATIRACVVAISASNAAYADWNASLVSIPASCVVHDSGMEFLPLRFRAIAELDAYADPLLSGGSESALIGPLEMVRESTTDQCVLAAVRHSNYEKLSSSIEWTRNHAGWFYSAANEWIDHYPVLPISWNRAIRSNSPFVARLLVSAFDRTSLVSVRSTNDILVADTALAGAGIEDGEGLLWDCDQSHCGPKYQLQQDLADSDSRMEVAVISDQAIASPSDLGKENFRPDALSGCEAASDSTIFSESELGVLPSGHPANIFVFTLQSSSQLDERFQVEDELDIAGSTETFDALADRSLSAAIASRTVRADEAESIDSFDGEFCSQLVSGTEVDAPILENRFPIEEGCIPSTEFLPRVFSDGFDGNETEGTPAIASAPEHVVKSLKDSVSAVSMVPEQIAVITPNADVVSPEAELCLPLASDFANDYDAIGTEAAFANTNESDRVAADRIPIDPALSMELDGSNESWRSLFRPHGCIFAPEYLIDQPSVGIRSNTAIEPDPISEDVPAAAPLDRNLAAVDAALRDPIGIGLDLSAMGKRYAGSVMADPEMQNATASESVRWSDSAWVGYANDIAVNDSNQTSSDVAGRPMTRVLAQGLRWFGDWMLQWSDTLEWQIRMAEGSERAATHDR